ncbi:TetR/AcrR family transcriptional regulator [Actinomadura madurae]|uniref:TetR/AcrR family transcriptional regulator n=1 Tax=Actinomadura madurae TaxID=1993 RepID=UPI0020D244B4|nr:TetR family transcriptional regulator [Actinomadura madurae]MCP9953108.1 TetR family transcriptional regulator [Actinomadura madurae]MCP9969874.1 TetR family transcriptional regulator [Actinomadura madurae]MCP9982323.1 TetR family transcriptional regulator [Actinomadura madurae]MCQ0006148.1 TetR family transcriptional regulator [Actinomadura madurae]
MSGQAGNPEGCADVLPGSRSALDPGRAIKPGRHGLSPETVAGIQRERLIDAFVQIVSERGYGHTTISRVTEGAGVTKKTFYAHFTDLDDCFLAAYQRGMDILLGRMTQAYESAPSWPEGIHAALRTLLAVLAREPRFARASLVEVNAAARRSGGRASTTSRGSAPSSPTRRCRPSRSRWWTRSSAASTARSTSGWRRTRRRICRRCWRRSPTSRCSPSPAARRRPRTSIPPDRRLRPLGVPTTRAAARRLTS